MLKLLVVAEDAGLSRRRKGVQDSSEERSG